jgi:hypothetical protein
LSAAGREIRIGAGREDKHGRDQREAEEKKQGDAEKASHRVIVAKLFGDGVCGAVVEARAYLFPGE